MTEERHFDQELHGLEMKVLEMGDWAKQMINLSIKALVERDEALTRKVFDMENSVNHLHMTIDDTAIKLIARHQPMAVDLRFLAAAMKVNTDLERIADMTVNACQTGYYHLFKEPPVEQISMISHMAEVAQEMVHDSLEAFSKRSVTLAKRVMEKEEEEDRLKAQALADLLTLIKKDPPRSEVFVELILLSRNMERIGDHATNIAEDVVFMVLGQDIRHPGNTFTPL